MVGRKACHMFSSRLFPHFVRAVSFQTCDTPSRTADGALVSNCIGSGACRRFRLNTKRASLKGLFSLSCYCLVMNIFFKDFTKIFDDILVSDVLQPIEGVLVDGLEL
ncbi:hypothetical protein E8L90_00605 [Brevibacillus antibioticus]|uniref:Uncharacterized protein n=1 Tax=Brevibacillus antibioticus TaxID=2570228 RepID=A0A4U2Y4D5_9BACL|nr:hypothetical protein E8L90_00605 [Brevibacillus antibioticus]